MSDQEPEVVVTTERKYSIAACHTFHCVGTAVSDAEFPFDEAAAGSLRTH